MLCCFAWFISPESANHAWVKYPSFISSARAIRHLVARKSAKDMNYCEERAFRYSPDYILGLHSTDYILRITYNPDFKHLQSMFPAKLGTRKMSVQLDSALVCANNDMYASLLLARPCQRSSLHPCGCFWPWDSHTWQQTCLKISIIPQIITRK